jgi:hypothetical protein
MNYAEARQRMGDNGLPSGLWDWTSKNDEVIHAAGPCAARTCEHHSKEEAERHYYDWSLEKVKEFSLERQQVPCEVCGEWTQKGLHAPGYNTYGFEALLCDRHRNKEELIKLRPFTPGIQSIHS